jgi:hypothetical protein
VSCSVDMCGLTLSASRSASKPRVAAPREAAGGGSGGGPAFHGLPGSVKDPRVEYGGGSACVARRLPAAAETRV